LPWTLMSRVQTASEVTDEELCAGQRLGSWRYWHG